MKLCSSDNHYTTAPLKSGQLKKVDFINADGTQSTFVLTVSEKFKETRLKFSQENATVL